MKKSMFVLIMMLLGFACFAKNQEHKPPQSCEGYVITVENKTMMDKNLHIYTKANERSGKNKKRYNWNLNGWNDVKPIDMNVVLSANTTFTDTIFLKYNPPFKTNPFFGPGDLVIEADGKPIITIKPDLMSSGTIYLWVVPVGNFVFDKQNVDVICPSVANGNVVPMTPIEITYNESSSL